MSLSLPQRVFFKIKNTVNPAWERSRFELYYRCNALADSIFSPSIDPEQSVIINGFWRSGTTWIQDLVCRELVAKPLFEPFEPGIDTHSKFIFHYARAFGTFPDSPQFVACLMPNTGTRLPTEKVLWEYLHEILKGRHLDPGLLRNRRSLWEGARRHIALKFVRGHFILDALHERFRLPVIHVRRDPYSVIGGLVKNPSWNFGGFGDLDLKRLLLSEEDGKAELLAPLRRQILYVDEKGNQVMKIAAYWAATEWLVERKLDRIGSSGVRIDFEDVVQGGASFLRDCLSHLGLKISGRLENSHMRKRSSTTHASVKYASRDEFVTRSRDRLTERQRVDIQSVLVRFGVVKSARAPSEPRAGEFIGDD